MDSVILASLIAFGGRSESPKIVAPRASAACMGSSFTFQIGNDNVPVENPSIGTSIVNIWAFIPENDPRPVAWLFKNARNEYFMAFATNQKGSSYRAIPFYWRYFPPSTPPPTGSGGYRAVVKVSPSQLVNIENILGARGIVRVSCFTHDYRM